ncbi:hypothetical protein [Tumebacillus flagellatus]|uniref:Uncharacterized protein n=1 Tax=Tumebacillus flagellatus TaxID=1157490 RepID=A0A074LTN1_9BACL|nr:hypothetical protein [Tumebacillus flagellatus]KEO84469.1 hypothetical protein EL26_05055 [Tumebacillus flagellatus]
MERVKNHMEQARLHVHDALQVTQEDKKRLAEAVLKRVRTGNRKARTRAVSKVAVPIVAAVVLIAGGTGLLKAGYLGGGTSATKPDVPVAVTEFPPDVPQPPSDVAPLTAPKLDMNQEVEQMTIVNADRTVLDVHHNKATGQSVIVQLNPDGSKKVMHMNVRELGSYILTYDKDNHRTDAVFHKHPPISDGYDSDIKEWQTESQQMLEGRTDVQKDVVDGVPVLVVRQPIAPKDGRNQVEAVYYDEATLLRLKREVYTEGVLDEVQTFTYRTMDAKDFDPKFFEIPKGSYKSDQGNQIVEKQ